MTVQNNIDMERLAAVAVEAIVKVHLSGKDVNRWVNAIAKATVEIENNPFMTWLPQEKHLVLWSQRSSNIYEANGTCSCRAYEQGFPCYHRAAARLIQRYLEVQ